MFRRITPTQLTVDLGIAFIAVTLRLYLGVFGPVWIWVLVVLAMGAALGIRRLSPGLALAIAWVGALLQMLGGLPPDASNLAILPVLFATARYGEPLVKWLGLASAILGAFVSTAYVLLQSTIVSGTIDLGNVLLLFGNISHLLIVGVAALGAALAALGLSWTLGLLVRTWATASESRRAKAAAEKVVIVEQERNRIARDMHDVVAHSLAVVIAQADGARYTKDPATTETALATISTTAREALADVRLLLGELRHNQDAGPQPVLADLDRLVEQLRSSGLVVALEQRGEPATLPAGKQLAIYRIVQEALTNALRHGDLEEEVVATIDWTTDAADITVSNALRDGAHANPGGHGVAGMRERAQLVGGTLDAAEENDHFVVHARIPVAA